MSPHSIDSVEATIEREIKVVADDPAATVEAIQSAGGSLRLERHWERNWILDRSEELLLAGSLLRVRDRWSESGAPLGAVVTVKRALQNGAPRDTAIEGIKERYEQEVEVADAARSIRVFSQLGYRVARRYHKVRTAWCLDDHEVVLDETPIGPWIEIEGPDPARVARRLGLPERGELRNYLTIYEAERLLRPELPSDMVFTSGHRGRREAVGPSESAPVGFESVRPPTTMPGPAADSGQGAPNAGAEGLPNPSSSDEAGG